MRIQISEVQISEDLLYVGNIAYVCVHAFTLHTCVSMLLSKHLHLPFSRPKAFSTTILALL